jgi:hypothetical protein
MGKTRSGDRERYWREIIGRQEASGQSIVRFCAQEKVALASFHAWKRRLRQGRPETGRKTTGQSFVPVQIVGDPETGIGQLEVQWPGGVVLRVQGFDVPTVGAVIAGLSVPTARRARRC